MFAQLLFVFWVLGDASVVRLTLSCDLGAFPVGRSVLSVFLPFLRFLTVFAVVFIPAFFFRRSFMPLSISPLSIDRFLFCHIFLNSNLNPNPNPLLLLSFFSSVVLSPFSVGLFFLYSPLRFSVDRFVPAVPSPFSVGRFQADTKQRRI